jgi:C1A family cysteine protease
MEQRYALGCLKDHYDPRDYRMSDFLQAFPTPDRVDHAEEMPPIFDQGPRGTCVACAAGYYDKSYQEGGEHGWDLAGADHQFSPLFIYSQREDRSGDFGMSIRAAMKIIYNQGVCPLSEMPYDVDRIDTPPTDRQLELARPFRAKSYARLTSIYEMEQYLLNNCFIAGVLVHQRFLDAPGGVIGLPEPGEAYVGGHAVCVVGFDRRNHFFKFINSWGPNWGDDGFGHISYAAMQALLMDAWGMVDAPDDVA